MDWAALIVAGLAGFVTLVQYFINRKDKIEGDKCGYAAAFIQINERLDRREEENRLQMECIEVLLKHSADGNHTGECTACAEKIKKFRDERTWNK